MFQPLTQVPAAVARADALVAGLDQCLLVGFGRLGAEQAGGLDALGRATAGTPLEGPLSRALAALRGNEFQPAHFAVLAAARAALQGARYDALLAQANEVLGRAVEPPVAGESAGNSTGAKASNGSAAVLCESTRHWLMELAITGFKQLDTAALAPFAATLENLQNEPALARAASLLSGFQQELLAALPIGHASVLPTYRWGDLWSAAMVTSYQAERGAAATAPAAVGKVAGTFAVLGTDLRQHGCFVSAVIYGVLESGGDDRPRVARVTLSSYKVDALQGREVWRCFAGGATSAKTGKGEDGSSASLPLLRGVAEHLPLKVKGMTLLPTGDLLWDGAASETNKPADPFALAAKVLAPGAPTRFPLVAPADRHPVQLAEPVLLQNVKVEKVGAGGLRVVASDGSALPVAESRLVPGGELTPEDVTSADTVLGLLRFDAGQWMVQPLAVRPGATKERRAIGGAFVGSDAYEVVTRKPKKGEPNTLAVLQERAGRLLRRKS